MVLPDPTSGLQNSFQSNPNFRRKSITHLSWDLSILFGVIGPLEVEEPYPYEVKEHPHGVRHGVHRRGCPVGPLHGEFFYPVPEFLRYVEELHVEGEALYPLS